MDDLLLELLRPLDARERLRAKRMARAARLAPDPTMRRRAAKSHRIKLARRRRISKAAQVA
jgi:hypothetical protein